MKNSIIYPQNILAILTKEFENVTDFGMPIDFIEDEEYSGIIKLLVPIYIAEIKTKIIIIIMGDL